MPIATRARFIWGICLVLGAAGSGRGAEAPAWWAAQEVLIPGAPVDDFAVANIGQLKSVAAKAALEFDLRLPGGRGAPIEGLVSAWGNQSVPGDYVAINLGQLKTVAAPFWDRLIAVGASSAYPWTASLAPADDYALANLGQVKQVFSFDFNRLSLADGPVAALPGDQLRLWLRASSEPLGPLTLWHDRSSAGNDAWPQTDPTKRPTVIPNAVNGRAVVRFDGNDRLSLRDLLSGATAGEIFAVLKADPSSVRQG